MDVAAEKVAREVWTNIGSEFNANREKNRTLAYRVKQRRLNENFGILTAIMSAKDLNDEIRRCEDFMGTDPGSQGGNAMDELCDFINGKDLEKRVVN